VVTSPGPAEGKTTVASNLSIAVAEMGRRVLLIDGDLRQPKLHKIFGVANNRGVNDLLLADSDLASMPLNEMVMETRVTGLSLLPSGSRANNISQLLHSSRIEELLNRMRGELTW
jgi:receptor protein-tyrosine kinase